MKKVIVVMLLFLPGSLLLGQTIPNADFSNWYIGGIDRLIDWGTSDGCLGEPQIVSYYVSPGLYWSDAPCDSCVRLLTQADTISGVRPSFIFSGPTILAYTDSCDLIQEKTGVPFPYRPSHMTGLYQFSNTVSVLEDFGYVSVRLKKTDSLSGQSIVIGEGNALLGPSPDSMMTPFEVSISYTSTSIPDSIEVVIFSSVPGSNIEGGQLYIDDLQFDFLSSISPPLVHSDVAVFPNPIDGQFTLVGVSSAYGTLSLWTMEGQLLTSWKNRSLNDTFNLPDLPTGLYVLTIMNTEGWEWRTLVSKQ